MKFGSVCSGIEAASVAWNPLGWKAQWLAEIEPFPCSVLKHHYPDTPNLGDMTKFNDWPTDDKHAIDLLCGGTPCQSFSVAGLRKGLDDPRGNLMLTFGAIAAKYRPQWLVWENVPGVLSSNGGRDFGSLLGMLGQLGYGFAYRVLDAQYFGVAQRRRRVFVVGCLGDWRSAAAVLFERHSLQGHPAPSRQARKNAAAGAGDGTAFCVRPASHGAAWKGDGSDNFVAGTLCVATGQAGAEIGADMAPTLNCNHEAPYAMYQTAHTLRGEGFDASEDGTGRGTPLVPVSYAIQAGALRTNPLSGPDGVGVQSSIAYTLEARAEVQAIAFDTTQITSAANHSNPKAGDPCHPLAAQAHVPCIAFPERMSGTQCASAVDVAPSMGAANPTAVATRQVAQTITSNYGKQCDNSDTSLGPNVAIHAMQVRRLTPGECEKLQGFPPEYTNVPHRGKPAADGPRYKSLGNSWAVPNVRWIGRRIDAVELINKATNPVAELEVA